MKAGLTPLMFIVKQPCSMADRLIDSLYHELRGE